MGIGLGIGINRSNYAQGIFGAYQSRVIADGGVTEAGACVDAVSGLLLTASLLLIPSGYKSGKAYAQIPTNENGDLSWTRASTALRTNSSGLLESMGSGVPRLSYMYGSCPALLLEPQRTNLLLRSEEFDNAAWAKFTTTVTANAEVSPDGSVNADTMTVSTTDSRVEQTTILGAGTYTFSVYVKIISQTTAGTMRLQGFVDGAGVSVIFTPTTEWQRFTTTYTAAATLTSLRVRGQSFVGTLAIWGAQLEAGAYPTTYIPTTTASATRVSDSFSRNNIFTNGLITSSGGTWFVELRGNVSYLRDSGGRMFIGNDVDVVTATYLLAIGSFDTGISQRVVFFYKNGGAFVKSYTTTTDTTKIAIKWNGTTADVFVNGTKVVSAISFGITNMQNFIANGQLNPTFIQSMALYPTPLSDTDCTTLTTL
jgi:hypothetical protein